MTSPHKRTCQYGLFFSNPNVMFNGQRLGNNKTNNALWIKTNRFALQNVGNEKKTCSNSYLYNENLLKCFLSSPYVRTSCDETFL